MKGEKKKRYQNYIAQDIVADCRREIYQKGEKHWIPLFNVEFTFMISQTT